MVYKPRVPRRIVSRTPIFGDIFASDEEVLAEFEQWDKEDAEAEEELRLENEAHKRVRGKGIKINLDE